MNTEQQQSHLTSDCVGGASKTALPGHTPGPWRRGSDELSSPELFSEIYGPNGYRIAVCQTAHTRGKEQRESVDAARANAALIVRAVNSHDALVEALTCAKNILYLLTPEVSALGMRSYLIHEKIAAALAKAGVTP